MNLVRSRTYRHEAFNIGAQARGREQNNLLCTWREMSGIFNFLMLNSAECAMAVAHGSLPHVGFVAALLISTLKSHEGASLRPGILREGSQPDPLPCDL